MTIGQDDLTVNQMNFALTTNIVKGTPKWGQRAFSAFFDWKQNGIIYYLPEIKRETIEEDWRITLMVSVKDWIQENPSLFLPIVQAWDQDDRPDLNVPKLRNVIGVKEKSELPNLFLYHPTSQRAMPYPEPLDDMDKVSPELVMLWAKAEVLKIEVELLEKRLKEYDDDSIDAESKLTEEQKPKVEMHLSSMKPAILEIEE